MVYIVVPIFNTEKYLEQCLKSIHKQTYQNWKCLLVNDGSTDGCSQICETFANGDSRYVYIYEENKGLSAARNKGIECAIDFSGGGHDFVCFVDSDDYIEPDYLEKMLEPYQANSSLDLVICNYFNDNTPKENSFITQSKYGIRDRIETMREFTNPKSFKGFAWNKLYKLDLIEQNNLRYDMNCILVEDALFNHQYMSCCMQSYYVDCPLYHYITRSDSLTNQSFKEKNWKLLESYRNIIKFCGLQKDKELDVLLNENYLNHEITILKKMKFSKTPVDREKMQWLKEKVKSEIRSIWCAHNISLKRKLMAIYLSF